MKIRSSIPLLLIGGGALLALTGCEQIEQAATQAVDQAKQTAVQALDEAQQNGSLDQAREAVDRVLQDARQEAAGLLGEASQYLSSGETSPLPENGAAESPETSI